MLLKSNNPFVTRCGPVTVLPGANEIAGEAELEYLKTDAMFKTRCELGQFELIGKSDEDKQELTFDTLSAVNAIKLTKDIFDRALLVKLIADEERATVLVALQKQLDTLNAGSNKKEDK